MADRRDRSAEVHMMDGLLRKGRLIGHSDPQGRIREADGTFRRGQELGYVDDKQRVRRKAGLVGRGDIVGRIKGNAIYGRPGLLATARKLGRLDGEGLVWQCDCAAFRGRVVGRARGRDPEAALAYFLLKFQTVNDHVETLEEKVAASTDKFAFLPRVRAMLKLLPEVDAIGDFDDVVKRLEALELACAEQMGEHFLREEAHVKGLRDSVTRLGEAASLEALRAELNLPARDGIERAEALVGKVRGALRREGRRSQPPEAPRGGAPDPHRPGERGSRPPGSIPPDMLSPLEAILTSTLGPMEKLREEVDRVRRDPEYGAEELWERVRATVASLVEYRDVTAAVMGRVPHVPMEPLLPPPMEDLALPLDPPPGFLATSPRPSARAKVDELLDSPAATQVFAAIDGAVHGFDAIKRAREDGLRGLEEALDEGIEGLRALAKARDDGAAGLRSAINRLRELRRPSDDDDDDGYGFD